MLSTFKENQIIKIVPTDIEAACSMRVLDSCDEFLCVTPEKTIANKDITGKVECFALAEDGIIYFNSKISKIDDQQYKLTLPITQKILQRREYTRVEFNANIVLNTHNQQVDVLITDLSAGGMRVVSQKELSMSEDYSFTLHLDKVQTINAIFAPIRQDKNDNNAYLTSGKFKMLPNKDRITLAQFCFKKQMENTNK